MATGQSLLDRMELLNQELQLQSGEADVARGLLALNVAQDYFESLAAVRGKIFGSKTGTVATVSQTETTAFPSGVLRVDRLQVLNDAGRPKRELDRLARAGGHAMTSRWPRNITDAVGTGEPRAYWTDGTSIYWNPLPSGAATVRWYGFQAASDITAVGTFSYPDIVMLPLASFACQILKSGLDDPVEELSGLATTTFKGVLDSLENFNRDGSVGFEYTEVHSE